MLLHAPKSTVIARLRYLVSKSAQGSNAKVTVEYSIKLWLEFSKIKAERKPVDNWNVPLFPMTPSTPNLNPCAPKLSYNLRLVCFLGFKIKNMQMAFCNKQNLSKERTSCLESNCKMYHVMSDTIAITINSIIQNWATSNWENLAKRRTYNYAIFCIQHADW